MKGHLMSYVKVTSLYSSNLSYLSVGLLFSPFLIFSFFTFLYMSREAAYFKEKYSTFIIFTLILSELLLFVGFLWGFLSCYLSPSMNLVLLPTEGLMRTSNFCAESNYILFIISLFIIHADYCRNKFLRSFYADISIFFLLGLYVFYSILEFVNISFFINDSTLGTYFFIFNGFHMLHIFFGVILFFAFRINNKSSYKVLKNVEYSDEVYSRLYFINSYVSLHYSPNILKMYWHFLELICLIIHITLSIL